MKRKLANQFAVNYLIVFLLSILAALCALALMSFAGSVIQKTLTRNDFPASGLMRDDYENIDAAPIAESGGGVLVINKDYEVVYSAGLDTIGKARLTAQEFTDFLMQSRSVGLPYYYDILYNDSRDFWLVVVFPTSVRIDFEIASNDEYISKDMQNVSGVLAAVLIFYLLLLALFAFIFSRLSAVRVTKPLRKLIEGTKRLREGDYAVRIDLKLRNEFRELQDTFNAMAERIEHEITLRKQSEDDRKRLILDISHDLKTPLASAAGYAELLLDKPGLTPEERTGYLRIIHQNSMRAGRLLNGLFELSKLDSPDFRPSLQKTDLCEFLRETCAGLLPMFEEAGFVTTFDIPDEPLYALLDPAQLSRVFHNLADNAVRYNKAGTALSVRLTAEGGRAVIVFKDNGVGIPEDKARDIFKPFVRADDARSSSTGGSGLGLSIALKIAEAHHGTLSLETGESRGCAFLVTLPII
jgi:signal transduction histidine kinase